MLKLPKLNLLVAFPYFSKSIYKLLLTKDPDSFRLIIDSGAFTAWNTGKQISLDNYAKFLKTIPSHWEYKSVQLDVFGNPEQTYINYLKMMDMGFNEIMPVFTRGDSLERLEEFYSYTNYIMFGGIVVGGENKNYVKWFCEMNKGRKAHWLGFVNLPFMKHYKPYSVDSSSWTRGARFGTLEFYNGFGEIKIHNKKIFIEKPPEKIIKVLKESGFTVNEILALSNKESWTSSGYYRPEICNKSLAFFMTALAHVRRSLDVEKKLGTQIYLACGGENQVETLFECVKFLNERNVKY